MHFSDSFSEEEDEFIMAEDNAAAEIQVGQEELRNLHIEGKQTMSCSRTKFHSLFVDFECSR